MRAQAATRKRGRIITSGWGKGSTAANVPQMDPPASRCPRGQSFAVGAEGHPGDKVNDLVGNRGYALLEERKVRDRAGREGLELRFETTAGGEAQGYLATLFVFPGWLHNTIRVAELVAPREVFQKELPGVRAAIETIRP